jgi:hypothetical protein
VLVAGRLQRLVEVPRVLFVKIVSVHIWSMISRNSASSFLYPCYVQAKKCVLIVLPILKGCQCNRRWYLISVLCSWHKTKSHICPNCHIFMRWLILGRTATKMIVSVFRGQRLVSQEYSFGHGYDDCTYHTRVHVLWESAYGVRSQPPPNHHFVFFSPVSAEKNKSSRLFCDWAKPRGWKFLKTNQRFRKRERG